MSTVLDELPILTTPVLSSREAAVFHALGTLEHGQSLRISGLSWDDYLRFDQYRDKERTKVKITYSYGDMEIVAPSFFHDRTSRRIAHCISAIADLLDLDYVEGGGTTFKLGKVEAGLEPDECFYFQNWQAVGELTDIDLFIHPPPDLAIEVDRYNSSLDKFSVYRRLGVPEIWRFDPSMAITFFARQPNADYSPIAFSKALPLLSSDAISRFFNSSSWPSEKAFKAAVSVWAASLVPPVA
jgi:Uma2 family endonuclease